MSSHKIEQRHLNYRGREFHFVSYEGQPANERRSVEAIPPMWCLMSGGKRLPVMPHIAGQESLEVDRELLLWVEEHAFRTPIKRGTSRSSGAA